MARGVTLTFEEGCNKYLENCGQRNLREGTIDKTTRSSHVLVKCRRGVIIFEFIVIKRVAQKSILSKISSKKILLLSVFSALILLGGDAREIL